MTGSESGGYKEMLSQEIIDGINLISQFIGNQNGFWGSLGYIQVESGVEGGSNLAKKVSEAVGGKMQLSG